METFSALMALCQQNPPVTGGFPSQRPVTWSFDVFFICTWTNGCTKNQDASDLRCHRAHYDVIIMDYRCLHLTANSYLVSIRFLKSCFRLGRHRCPRDWHMKNMAYVENILITHCISVWYTDVLRYYNIYYFCFLSISHAIWKIVPRMIWVQSSMLTYWTGPPFTNMVWL